MDRLTEEKAQLKIRGRKSENDNGELEDPAGSLDHRT